MTPPSDLTVMKFGGTSVGSSDRLRNAARVVHTRVDEGTRPVVVTSAMGGVTNSLESLLEIAAGGDRAALEKEMSRLWERHQQVAHELDRVDEQLVQRLDLQLRELRVMLRGVRLVGGATKRSADAVLGVGELLAQELLCAAMQAEGLDAQVVDSREVVVTDDRFGRATPDLAATREQAAKTVAPLVSQGRVPILGGYLGATPQGIATTLGRGGSDLSASVLGLALGADSVEIWTDVDGLMTADPRLVPEARSIPQLTFREAAELAGLGAKVLHPAAIDPAIAAGIPVTVRNSLHPERPGSRIHRDDAVEGVRAIALKEDLALVSVRAPGRVRTGGFLGEVLQAMGECGAVPLSVTPGPVTLEMLIEEGESGRQAIEALGAFGRLDVTADLSLVALVSEGIGQRCADWAALFRDLPPGRMIRVIQGPRGSSLGLVVERTDADDLVRMLHREWIEPTLVSDRERAE